MKKYVAAILALLFVLTPVSVYAATSFTLELSVKEVLRGGEITLSGTVADETDDVVVKIVSPNQTVLYIDVISAQNGVYSQTVAIPETEDLAPSGVYTVIAGNGGLTQSGTFAIPRKGGNNPEEPSRPSNPSGGSNSNPVTTTPPANNSDSKDIPPAAGQVSGANVQPELAKDGRYIAGSDVLAKAAQQASDAVTIELPASAAEAGSALEFPAKSLTGLEDREIDLIVTSGNRTVRFPAGSLAVSADELTRVRIVLNAAWSDEAKAVVEQSLRANPDYTSTGVVLSVVIQLISGDNVTEIHQLDKPAEVTLKLTDEQAKQISADLAGVYYVDGKTLVYTPGTVKNGTFNFTVGHFSYYTILQYSKTFVDLVGHWAENSVKSLAAKGIVKGVDENHYAPGRSITRAEYVALIMRTLEQSGKPLADQSTEGTFTDVPASQYYTRNVADAAALGIITGYNGKFRPNDQITREEAVVALVRAADYFNLAANGGQPAFADAGSISGWAKAAVDSAWSKGLIQGDGQKFSPDRAVNRAEVAVMVKRLITDSSL
ncbi:S-layer homology domain-containing protein [Paenibacillus macerans]|uniref:S-layer homology domain-containing protein n=1 Tax=Paenibacillus macerans TaxID=44252 RepID=UPI0020405F54|nr:S-layer homology domain-containing protein [Paenibacillus macerans]MCM3700251.1 S-layer homology domain-containing protein [Paenibacillus macerans]